MMLKMNFLWVITLILMVLMGLEGCGSSPEPATTGVPTQTSTSDVLIKIPDTNSIKEQDSTTTPATDTVKVTPIGPQVGKLAPDFSYRNSEGTMVYLSNLRGSSVILNFWATWCGPCKYEMPFLQDLANDKEKANKGLVLLTVDVGESADTVKAFLQSSGYSFTVLLDTQRKIASTYYVRSYPTTFFIAQNGIINSIQIGAFLKESELEQRLEALIKSGS